MFWHFSVPTVQQHRHWRSNPAKRPRGRNAKPKPDLSSAASTLELSWKTGTRVMELNFTKDTIKEEKKKNKRKKKKIEEENKRFELSSVLKPM